MARRFASDHRSRELAVASRYVVDPAGRALVDCVPFGFVVTHCAAAHRTAALYGAQHLPCTSGFGPPWCAVGLGGDRRYRNILSNHLDPDDEDSFWEYIDLDLTGPTLIDFSLYEGSVYGAGFSGALFIGYAFFSRTTFAGVVDFSEAVFLADVTFDGETFARCSWFSAARPETVRRSLPSEGDSGDVEARDDRQSEGA